MTDDLFFDTDCISAFLWVNEQSIVSKLYGGRIVIPKQTYDEISYVPHLKNRIDVLIKIGDAEIQSIEVGTKEYDLFIEMTLHPMDGYKSIGAGEAASISMAKERNGIVASNNLKDIDYYLTKYSLKHITTGDIMVLAFKNGLITEEEGNNIWKNMLSKKRKLGALSFSEYLENNT